MDNFDKLFNEKLNEITEHDFDMQESSWERFHNQWNEEEKRTRVVWLWVKRNVIAAAVIGFLLTSNVFFAQQSIYTQSRMKELVDSISTIQKSLITSNKRTQENAVVISALNAKLKQQETVIAEQKALLEAKDMQQTTQSLMDIRHQFSTEKDINSNSTNPVNQYNNIDNNSTNNTSNNSINNTEKVSNITPLEENGQQPTSENVGITTNNSTLTSETNTTVTTNDNIENNTISTIDSGNVIAEQQPTITQENQIVNNQPEGINQVDELSFLDNVPFTLQTNFDKDITLKNWPLAEVENEFKPSFETRLFMLKEAAKPSAYQVGVQSKYTISPTYEGLPSMNITNNGVIGNALFFNNLRLQVGANYWYYKYEIEDIKSLADDLITPILEGYPTILPLHTTDELTKIESKSNGFDFPMSAQILLRSQKALTPYIGFGVVGRFVNNYTSEHHFYEDTGDDDYELGVNELIRSFDTGIWQGQVGLDYKVYKNWLLNIELSYSKNFKTPTFGLTNIQEYGGSVSIKYNF